MSQTAERRLLSLVDLLALVWGWDRGRAEDSARLFLHLYYTVDFPQIAAVYDAPAGCGYSSAGAFPNRAFRVWDPGVLLLWAEEQRVRFAMQGAGYGANLVRYP